MNNAELDNTLIVVRRPKKKMSLSLATNAFYQV